MTHVVAFKFEQELLTTSGLRVIDRESLLQKRAHRIAKLYRETSGPTILRDIAHDTLIRRCLYGYVAPVAHLFSCTQCALFCAG